MDPFGLKVIFITFLAFVPLERLFALHSGTEDFSPGLGERPHLPVFEWHAEQTRHPRHRRRQHFCRWPRCPGVLSGDDRRPAVLGASSGGHPAFRSRALLGAPHVSCGPLAVEIPRRPPQR